MLVYIGRNEINDRRCRLYSKNPTWIQVYHGTKFKGDGEGYEEYLGAWTSAGGFLCEMSHESVQLLTGLSLEPRELKTIHMGELSRTRDLLKKCINPLSQCSCPDAKKLSLEISTFLNIPVNVWEKLQDSCTPDHETWPHEKPTHTPKIPCKKKKTTNSSVLSPKAKLELATSPTDKIVPVIVDVPRLVDRDTFTIAVKKLHGEIISWSEKSPYVVGVRVPAGNLGLLSELKHVEFVSAEKYSESS